MSTLKNMNVKRPDLERPYKRATYPSDDLPPNWTSVLALLLGIAGLMMRQKPIAWAALGACMVTLGTLRYSRIDFKQLVTCVAFSFIGLALNYLNTGPAPGDQAAGAAPEPAP